MVALNILIFIMCIVYLTMTVRRWMKEGFASPRSRDYMERECWVIASLFILNIVLFGVSDGALGLVPAVLWGFCLCMTLVCSQL